MFWYLIYNQVKRMVGKEVWRNVHANKNHVERNPIFQTEGGPTMLRIQPLIIGSLFGLG